MSYSDVRHRIIQNKLNVLILCAFSTFAVTGGHINLGEIPFVYLILSPPLLLLFFKGLLGGGDVKFSLAVAPAIPLHSLGEFVFITAVAGGFIGVLVVIYAKSSGRSLNEVTVPYGVALAIGTGWVVSKHLL